MTGYTDPDGAQGADSTLDECLVLDDCVTLLETVCFDTTDERLINSLSTAALQTVASSHHIERLVAILDRGHVLPSRSALPITCILLASGDVNAREKGLHLLENQNEHDTEPPEECYLSQMKKIKNNLIKSLYAMLVEDRPAPTRRMVAKLLLDTLTQASDCDALLSPEECKIYYPRTATIFCEDKDIVLRFFAGAIIRTLYLNGADEDLLWNSCNPEYRIKFLKCLKEFPEDWALAFHRYQAEHHGPRNPRKTPGASCCIINSVTIPHIIEHDSILSTHVSTTPESLIFILPIEPTGCSQFIDIPNQYILQTTQCNAAKYKYALEIFTDEAGSFIINGKTEKLGSTISLASHTDFTDLLLSRIHPEPKPARRPSSMFITLDTADEVGRKSSEYRRKLSQGEEGIPGPSTNIHPEEPGGNPADGHDMARLTSATGRTSGPPCEPALPQETPPNETASDPISENAGMSQRFETLEEMPNRKQPCRRKTPTLPDTQESLVFNRPRRSNRSVYKAKPGPSVDWEEDLRPTPSEGDRTAESESQNDAEYTSISSPVPGDVSIFTKSSDTTKRKSRAPMTKEPRRKRVSRGIEKLPLATTEANNDRTGETLPFCETANGNQENSAIKTRSEKCSSANSTVPVRACEQNIQNRDQRGLNIHGLSAENVDRPSDAALASHPTHNNTNDMNNESTETRGISPKKAVSKTSGIPSSKQPDQLHLSNSNKESPGVAKKLRFDQPGFPELHQTGTKRALTRENRENDTKRIKVADERSHLPINDTQIEIDSQSTPIQHSTPSRRRYVVDETGSPRPNQGPANNPRFKKAIYLFEDSSSVPRHDSDSDTSNLADRSSSNPSSNNSPRHERTSNTMITPFSIPRSPHRAKKSQAEDNSKVNDGEKWESSLETVQQAMREMLQDTSKRFANQFDDERATITRVLETYRQGCNQVLDQLFQAHEERIELYKQQIMSVRRQHRDLCQDLVRQIEDNDRRIAERIAAFSDTGSP